MVVRGVSTVLDAALFCLLVTAAVATLTVPTAPPAGPPADGTADGTARALSTTTATVTVDAAGGRAHGPPADLLARAARRSASLDGVSITPDGRFPERVAAAAHRVAAHRSHRVRLRAVWRPYRNASLRGTVTAGPRPPADAEVDAATLTVPSGLPDLEARAGRAARADGYAGVARVLAAAVVRARFHPERMRVALYGPERVADAARARYRAFGDAVGEPVGGSPGSINATRTNRRLTAALAARIETDLRRRFDSPTAAAEALEADTVTVTVRTWSP
jgi:hypothetical protein